jgi:hypothetical protein
MLQTLRDQAHSHMLSSFSLLPFTKLIKIKQNNSCIDESYPQYTPSDMLFNS